jgi:hypothetical protein
LPLLFNVSFEYTIRNVRENQFELKLNGTHQLLTYADDVNLLEDFLCVIQFYLKSLQVYQENCVKILDSYIETINGKTETLIDASKQAGLEANVEETKYMLVSRDQNADLI